MSGPGPASLSGEIESMLQASRWARDLDPDLLDLVRSSLSVRDFQKGEFVCRKGEASDAWIGVVYGLVKSMNVSKTGKIATLTGVPPGGWFGEGALLKGEVRKYDVIALRDSRLACMPKSVFDTLLRKSIAFNNYIIVQLNERLGQFIAMLENERLFDPDVCTARTLAQLFNPHLYPSAGKHLSISQEEVGLLCGISRPRANQALHVLEEEGLLKVEYGGVTVHNLERLQSYEG